MILNGTSIDGAFQSVRGEPVTSSRDGKSIACLRVRTGCGELFDAETLDEVWPVEKKLEKQYWWDSGPATRTSAPER